MLDARDLPVVLPDGIRFSRSHLLQLRNLTAASLKTYFFCLICSSARQPLSYETYKAWSVAVGLNPSKMRPALRQLRDEGLIDLTVRHSLITVHVRGGEARP